MYDTSAESSRAALKVVVNMASCICLSCSEPFKRLCSASRGNGVNLCLKLFTHVDFQYKLCSPVSDECAVWSD